MNRLREQTPKTTTFGETREPDRERTWTAWQNCTSRSGKTWRKGDPPIALISSFTSFDMAANPRAARPRVVSGYHTRYRPPRPDL